VIARTCLGSAEDTLKQEREKRKQDEAELAKLSEQLKKARAKPAADPTECVDLFSGLLPQATLDKLSPEQIAERMQTLFSDRERRHNNVAARIDLVIGQLTEALYQQPCRPVRQAQAWQQCADRLRVP
jgi:hypothetical protein